MKKDTITISREVLQELGPMPAAVLSELAGLIDYNRRKDIEKHGADFRQCEHCMAGNWWAYGSRQAMAEKMGWLTESQFYSATKKLEAAGYMLRKGYNRAGYDRTVWYGLTEKGKAVCGWMTKEERKERKKEKEKAAKKEEKKAEKHVNRSKLIAYMTSAGVIDSQGRMDAKKWAEMRLGGQIDQGLYDAGMQAVQTMTGKEMAR